MLDRDVSLRLSLLRFPLIVGVVFVHAYTNTVELSTVELGVSHTNYITDFIRNVVSQVFARVSSPLFFVISGYLFFARSAWSIEGYLIKLNSRVKTLLVPFLFWNIATLLLIAFAQSIPFSKPFFSGNSTPIHDFTAYDYINSIFGLSGFPIAYQFWFVRDLMVMILLAPLINILNKYAPLIFIVGTFACWLIFNWPVSLPFFSIGAYLGSTNKNLFFMDGAGKRILIIYMFIAVFDALTLNQPFNAILHRVGIILGIMSALFLTKYIVNNERLKMLFVQLSGASFFVYAIHEPSLTILKKISYFLILPESSFEILSLYFLIPVSIIVLSLMLYHFLYRIFPMPTRVITGGR